MHLSAQRREALVHRLSLAGCVAADEEADELLFACGADDDRLEALAARRCEGEPLAWLVGSTPFAGRRVIVEPGVYVPRRQSEELAQRAESWLPERGRAVDLCTGSGVLASHLVDARPRAVVVASDLDRRAVDCARRNGVAAVLGDLDAPFAGGAFDVVCAVAPYVPHDAMHLLARDDVRFEPPLALDGGQGDGLDVVRRVVVGAARLLRPGGHVLVELGGDQDQVLDDDLQASGFVDVDTWRDEDGDLRGLEARRA